MLVIVLFCTFAKFIFLKRNKKYDSPIRVVEKIYVSVALRLKLTLKLKLRLTFPLRLKLINSCNENTTTICVD